ncbi:hypothetical protein M0804_014716 [Polistes exclamans]|nr:hypothetical protein M0804_014717 [Polistes exclamans]KAI4474698.1 hypothetical protein M0804_014716 [Polistes exclamans]
METEQRDEKRFSTRPPQCSLQPIAESHSNVRFGKEDLYVLVAVTDGLVDIIDFAHWLVGFVWNSEPTEGGGGGAAAIVSTGSLVNSMLPALTPFDRQTTPTLSATTRTNSPQTTPRPIPNFERA